MTRSILITGCSTGIGWHCALGMKARGWRVFATARKPEDLQRLETAGVEAIHLDYAEPSSVAACAVEVARRSGGKLDALFNNGAFGQPGAVEDLKVLFEVGYRVAQADTAPEWKQGSEFRNVKR